MSELFDLSEFEALKQRADESATAPRSFPVEPVEVNWNGQVQTLPMQLVLLDGDKQFVAFSPPECPHENFFVGAQMSQAPDSWHERFSAALCVSNSFWLEGDQWKAEAAKALEAGSFGRMRVTERTDASAKFDFFGSTGYMFSWDYIEYIDGMGPLRAAMASPDYDPPQSAHLWCDPREAKRLLLELSEAEVFALYDFPSENASEWVQLSHRWTQMSHEERCRFLPPIERETEAETLALMRAFFWSDPHWSDEEFAAKHADFRALWRQPRFWLSAHEEKTPPHLQTNLGTDRATVYRRLNPIVNAVFHRLEEQATSEAFECAPCVAMWMRVRGGYITEFGAPSNHEHLEARLLLQDFLAQHGQSLEELESISPDNRG